MTNETPAPVQSLHDQIMRLPCMPPKNANVNQMLAYKSGHRDARHAAAELAAVHEVEQAAPVAVPDELRAKAEKFVISRRQAAEFDRSAESELEDDDADEAQACAVQAFFHEEAAALVEQLLAAAPTPPAQQPRNRHGVDANYFHKKLGLVLRDFDSLMPDELARTLARLAKVADESVLLEAEFAGPPAQRSQLPDGYVLMPKALTSENGAKALLAGEFSIAHVEGCHGCDCTGGEEDEPCAYCGGTGQMSVDVAIDWTTVKAIYAKAIEHFAPGDTAAPEQQGQWVRVTPELIQHAQELQDSWCADVQEGGIDGTLPLPHWILDVLSSAGDTAAPEQKQRVAIIGKGVASTEAQEQADRVEDLAALARKLVRALRKAAPEHDLPQKALDYLQRSGLAGSPLRTEQAEQQCQVNRSVIRDVFLRNGFTIKEGHSDLKPYVYAAAEELLALDGKAVAAEQAAVKVPRELLECIVIAESQGDGPALHEAIDELRTLLEGDE